VISADTAAMQARVFGTNVTAEIQLYLLHGLLHLAGFDDATPSKRRQMRQLQKRFMTTVLRSGRKRKPPSAVSTALSRTSSG
jgi:probable rRNA maturation factor